MNDSDRLLQMTSQLGMPVQVSAGDGGIRSMAGRVAEARQRISRGTGADLSCGGVAGGWGN